MGKQKTAPKLPPTTKERSQIGFTISEARQQRLYELTTRFNVKPGQIFGDLLDAFADRWAEAMEAKEKAKEMVLRS